MHYQYAVQVTSEPNRIIVAVNKSNYTQEMIQKSKYSIFLSSVKLLILTHSAALDSSPAGMRINLRISRPQAQCQRLFLCYAGNESYISASVEQTVDLGAHAVYRLGGRYGGPL